MRGYQEFPTPQYDTEKPPSLIMLVEDDEDHAALTVEALKDNGVKQRILWFDQAESALDYLFGETECSNQDKYPLPDLIILDIRLPGKDGFELLKVLKVSRKTKRIPVVMLTSSEREEEIARSYDNGANSYIVKPVEYQTFRKRIASLRKYWTEESELPRTSSEALVEETQ